MGEEKRQLTDDGNRWWSLYNLLFLGSLATCVGFLAIVFLIAKESAEQGGGWPIILADVACWFDPVFLQYNMLLVVFSVLIIPFITLFYLRKVKPEKLYRLANELPQNSFQENKEQIEKRIYETFDLKNFLGCMSALTFVVLVGSGIILMLKPLPEGDCLCGVDYSRGANFLLLGPYMKEYIKGREYTDVITITLTGFQFGFLGAYVYFIGHFIRSYFTLDLTPNTFVVSCIRMVTGALLSLVLSFLFIDNQEWSISLLPSFSFFIGYFPSRGLLVIEKVATSLMKSTREDYSSTSLSRLPGMSYAHEIRLQREGFDNVENLAKADPLELAVHTGFSYKQLEQWVDQAKLAIHFGRDYQDFVRGSGLAGIRDLRRFLKKWRESGKVDEPSMVLSEATGGKMPAKIRVICQLEGDKT